MDSFGAVPIAQKTRTTTETFEQKLERLTILEQREMLRTDLPHKYGFNLYQWQIDFIDSDNKMNLLCAANQIGKSACNFLKMIKWATEPTLWPKLWKDRPLHFWYFLPGKDNLTTEFRTKWVPKFLPKGQFKDHPQYGWREEYKDKQIWAIHFNTGVSVYLHTYGQDVMNLQGATVDAIFVDEEVPWTHMPELFMRIRANRGYFNAVMTPTRGQEEWRRVFEERGDKEIFPEAYKARVSLFDCRQFADGSPSHWTEKEINTTINGLGTQSEIDLRVHGKFTVSEGLKIPSFKREVNVVKPIKIPHDWYWYSGVDPGGGGQGSLPAIVFVAVRPDYKLGRVVEVWRGTSDHIYTATDILDKYVEIKNQRPMMGEYFDYGSKDFGTLASRAGFSFSFADKDRKKGFDLLNALLKNGMMLIEDTEPNHDLVLEITTLREDVAKKNAPDDAIDAWRYAVVQIPWSMDGITGEKIIQREVKKTAYEIARPGAMEPRETENEWALDNQIADFNDLLD